MGGYFIDDSICESIFIRDLLKRLHAVRDQFPAMFKVLFRNQDYKWGSITTTDIYFSGETVQPSGFVKSPWRRRQEK
jgi:hypothetical protein